MYLLLRTVLMSNRKAGESSGSLAGALVHVADAPAHALLQVFKIVVNVWSFTFDDQLDRTVGTVSHIARYVVPLCNVACGRTKAHTLYRAFEYTCTPLNGGHSASV